MRRCLRKTLMALSFSLASVGMVAALGEPVEPRADDIVQTNAIPTSSAKHDHAAERRMQMTLPYVGRILNREDH